MGGVLGHLMSAARLVHVARVCNRRYGWRRRLVARSFLPPVPFLVVPCRAFAASSGGRKSNAQQAEEEQEESGAREDSVDGDKPMSTVSRVVLPVALGVVIATVGVSYAVGSSRLAAFREEVGREIQQGCPEIPEGALKALADVPIREFETNRLRAEVEWRGEAAAGQWRLEVQASRTSALVAWQVTSLNVLRASTTSLGSGLAPQTRQWSADARGQVRWQEVWQSRH